MPRLELYLLGPIRVTIDGRPVTGITAGKARALLAYLALEGRQSRGHERKRRSLNARSEASTTARGMRTSVEVEAHTETGSETYGEAHRREVLAGLLWPDSPDSDALISLRQALHKLRQALGEGAGNGAGDAAQKSSSPLLLVTPHVVQLNPGSYWLDANEFSALIEACRVHRHRKFQYCSGCHARLRIAADLYRGDLLEGLFLEDAQPFEEWHILRRENLRRQALDLFGHLAAYHEAHQDYEQAIHCAYRQIELEPWREEAHRQVMRLLAMTGQRNAALAQYGTCTRTLAQELGIEPASETSRLYERIKAGDHDSLTDSLSVAQRDNLPRQMSSFVGREGELARITERIDRADCSLLTLVGPGGVGKTRLAIQAASAQVGAFDDGVWFVPLAPVNTHASLVYAIAQAIGLRFEATQEPETQLLNHLQHKEMLLVLDNFEHLLDDSAGGTGAVGPLIAILRKAPRVSMLVTSREQLNLQAEHIFDIEGLSLPSRGPEFEKDYTPNALTKLAGSEAVRLFVERARQVQSQFALTPDNARGVVEVCRLVAGLPLGIVLATAWVRQFTLAEIASSIRDNLDFLKSSFRDASPQHSSLRAIFDHSWKLLSDEERRVFRNLSVFRGSWDQEAATEVAGASPSLLLSLADKSLLRWFTDPADSARRYEIHEVLRQFAAEQLDLAGEHGKAQARHADYFLHLSEQGRERLGGPESYEWLGRLDREHDNIRAALWWAISSAKSDVQSAGAGEAVSDIQHFVEVALRIAGAMGLFWQRRGYITEGRQLLESALSLAGRSPNLDRFRVRALHSAANLADDQGNSTLARAYFEEGLAIYREIGDARGIISMLNGLGTVLVHLGDYASGRLFQEEGLALARQLGDKLRIAIVVYNLAGTTEGQGDYPSARALFEESLALSRELGRENGVVLSLNNLGKVAYEQGDYTAARSHFEESLALSRDRDFLDKFLIPECLEGLARVTWAEWTTGPEGKQGEAKALEAAEQAARLWGAAEALREAIGKPLLSTERLSYDRDVAAARAQVNAEPGKKEAFEAAWAKGRTTPLEEIVAEVLEEA